MKNFSATNTPTRRTRLIELIKRIAKHQNKQQTSPLPLSKLLDQEAVSFGYKNWSLFHRDIGRMPDSLFAVIDAKVKKSPGAQEIAERKSIKQAAATEEMQSFVRLKYARLIDFAYLDSESENGYAVPSVDILDQLASEFGGSIPDELIESVAAEMEEDGPWGVENYGNY